MKKLYPLYDYVTVEELRLLGFSLKNRPRQYSATLDLPPNDVKAIFAGFMRCPKAGEWFLSGAVVGAYRAKNDLTTVYPIAKLVRVETTTVIQQEIVSVT